MENALELIADGQHLQFLMLPEGEDPDTLVRKEGADAFRKRIDSAVPLSRFLFDRQSEGLDLNLPEHRGELRARAEPLLNKMPRSTLRDAMWHEMMRLCGSRNNWQSRQGSGNRDMGWRGDRKSRVVEDRVDVRLSKDSTLCLALLEAPEMATEVLAQAKQNRQWPQAARLSDWLAQNDIQSQRELTRALATQKDARDRFFNLFDGLEHIPARDSTLAAARELLSPNEEAARQQRVATLLRNLATLSPEQREELRTLSAGTLNPKDNG
ncbi:MAG: hypothetical protein B7X58_06545 [Marinobacter sp. 34-60-7]|nr:MAG: hypothetical protein B7X58_06545 [Marinobacter sp. 34-60-7]